MNETDKVEFHIEVSAADIIEEDIDRLTLRALSELRAIHAESAQELQKFPTIRDGGKTNP